MCSTLRCASRFKRPAPLDVVQLIAYVELEQVDRVIDRAISCSRIEALDTEREWAELLDKGIQSPHRRTLFKTGVQAMGWQADMLAQLVLQSASSALS